MPIGSMYGIFANIWGILMVDVTIYCMAYMDPMGYINNINTNINEINLQTSGILLWILCFAKLSAARKLESNSC